MNQRLANDKVARVIAFGCLIVAALSLLCISQSRAYLVDRHPITRFRRTLTGLPNNQSGAAATHVPEEWTGSWIFYPGYARIGGGASSGLYEKTQEERIEYLEHHPELTNVMLSRPTHADLKALATMPNLKRLELHFFFVDADLLRELSRAKNLNELVIWSGFDLAHPLPKSFDLANIKSIDLKLIPEWMSPAGAGDQEELLALNRAKNSEKMGALDHDLYFPHPEKVPSFDAATIPTDANLKALLLVCSTVEHGAQIARAPGLERLQIEAIDLSPSAYPAIASLKHLTDLGLYVDRYKSDDFNIILKNPNVKVVSVFKPNTQLEKMLCDWAHPLSLFVQNQPHSYVTFSKDESASVADASTDSRFLKGVLGAATRLRLIVCPSSFASVIETFCDPTAGWKESPDKSTREKVIVSPEDQKKMDQFKDRIQKENSENRTINTKGEFVVAPSRHSKVESPDPFALRFSEGLRMVMTYNQELTQLPNNERYQISYKDKSDKTVIPPFSASWAGDFHDGLACIQSLDGQWHYIDKTGKTVISLPSTVSRALEFHAGLAPVAVGGWNLFNGQTYNQGAKWGFIDKLGHTVVQPSYDVSLPGWGVQDIEFHDGLARVCVSVGLWQHAFGYINEKGEIAIKPAFKWAEDFSDGVATVRVGTIQSTPKFW